MNILIVRGNRPRAVEIDVTPEPFWYRAARVAVVMVAAAVVLPLLWIVGAIAFAALLALSLVVAFLGRPGRRSSQQPSPMR
jgi:predicted permease